MSALENLKNTLSDTHETLATTSNIGKGLSAVALAILTVIGITGYIWDHEPGTFNVAATTQALTNQHQVAQVTGSATIATMIQMADTLLHKRGGYLTNDIIPPSTWMDNVPNWEFGVIVQIRDMARTLRNNMSRSQSQSMEDEGLVTTENQFYFDNDTWLLPETEAEYEKGIASLEDYLIRLGDPNHGSAQFYARADNLRIWLGEVETRLGSLSQHLSASVGKRQLDTSLAGETAARQSTETRADIEVKTPWTELDDVFYQARGTTWALIHLL